MTRYVVADVDSPFGPLLVAATGRGLARLAFPEERREALEELADAGAVEEDPGLLAGVRAELEGYFGRHRRGFDLALDLSDVSGFRRDVLGATARIPYGSVATYGEIAARAGSPRAARAAGNALNANPVPIVVPCHRVVPASGGVGSYGGHEERKAFLLRLEGSL